MLTADQDQKDPGAQRLPTYRGIVTALTDITVQAEPGDQVYLHFSGHGGRVPTDFPALKGADALDETLVPCDIGAPHGRHLRDLELAFLLRRMVERGLFVTVVLDSCHAGGATRGAQDARARGIATVDRTARPVPSLVGTSDELVADWLAAGGGPPGDQHLGWGTLDGSARVAVPAAGWLPDPSGYVLLAACRPSESAYEFPFDGANSRGALSYWLLDALQGFHPATTYQSVYDRVLVKVHSRFRQQIPMLQGEGHRTMFVGDPATPLSGVLVSAAFPGEVSLATGHAQGVEPRARFVVYSSSEAAGVMPASEGMPASGPSEAVPVRLATVEVTEAQATESTARVVTMLRDEPIRAGMRAVLVDPGGIRLQRAVRVVGTGASAAAVRQQIAADGTGFIRPADDGEAAEFVVTVEPSGELRIGDAAAAPLPHLPPMRADSEAVPLATCLAHLSRFQAILELDDHDPFSPVARALELAIVGRALTAHEGERPELIPLDDRGPTPWIQAGEWVTVRLRNAGSTVLNMVVMDLQPDWGVSQVHPLPWVSDWEPLDPGEERDFELRAELAPGSASSTGPTTGAGPRSDPGGTPTEQVDVLKAFATVEPISFRWLTLPSVDRAGGPPDRPRHGTPTTALERLFALLSAGSAAERTLVPGSGAPAEWATTSLEMRIRP